MTNQEIIRRTQEAAKLISQDIKDLISADSMLDDYWANSASQSYVNDVESGNVRVVEL